MYYPPSIHPKDTTIADVGASDMYMTKESPCSDCNTNVPPIVVITATGHTQKSVSSCTIPIPKLPFRHRHIMPAFSHNLMGIGTL